MRARVLFMRHFLVILWLNFSSQRAVRGPYIVGDARSGILLGYPGENISLKNCSKIFRDFQRFPDILLRISLLFTAYLCNFILTFRENTISSLKTLIFSYNANSKNFRKNQLRVIAKCPHCLTHTPSRLFQRKSVFFLKNAEFGISPIGSGWRNRRSQERCYFECINTGPGQRFIMRYNCNGFFFKFSPDNVNTKPYENKINILQYYNNIKRKGDRYKKATKIKQMLQL